MGYLLTCCAWTGIHYRKTGALRRVDKLNNCGRSAKRRCLDIARQQTFLSEGVLPAQESPTISETHSASSNRDPSPAFFSTPLKDNAIATTNQKLSQGMAILQKIESKSESFTLPFDVSQHWLTNDTTEFDELHFEDLEAIADLFDAIDDPFDEFLRQLES